MTLKLVRRSLEEITQLPPDTPIATIQPHIQSMLPYIDAELETRPASARVARHAGRTDPSPAAILLMKLGGAAVSKLACWLDANRGVNESLDAYPWSDDWWYVEVVNHALSENDTARSLICFTVCLRTATVMWNNDGTENPSGGNCYVRDARWHRLLRRHFPGVVVSRDYGPVGKLDRCQVRDYRPRNGIAGVKYEDLPLLPRLIAETVCDRRYTGEEISVNSRSAAKVAERERKRQALTPEQRAEFADLCDAACWAAYEAKADWFLKCVRAKGNAGRDQLYNYLSHWLAGYLQNPETLRRKAGRRGK